MTLKKKLIAALVLSSLLVTSLFPAFASSDDNAAKRETSQDTINKIDVYVKIDDITKLFYLEKDAKDELSKSELELAQKLLKISNDKITEQLKSNPDNVTINSNKSVTINGDKSINGIMSIQSSIDRVEQHWWGVRRYANDASTKWYVSEFKRLSNQAALLGAIAGMFGQPSLAGSFLFVSVYWEGLAGEMESRNNGNGVIVDYNYIGYYTVVSQ